MTSWDKLAEQVEVRPHGRCEYCRMHQALQGATFHVEHIMPGSRAGPTVLDNLAWSCPGCNLRKSARIEGLDPESGALVPLFNPRTDRWSEHFRWQGYLVAGQTPVGKMTTSLLELNHVRRVLIRRAEELFGLFPPRDEEDVRDVL
jgi:hypothetical protein